MKIYEVPKLFVTEILYIHIPCFNQINQAKGNFEKKQAYMAYKSRLNTIAYKHID